MLQSSEVQQKAITVQGSITARVGTRADGLPDYRNLEVRGLKLDDLASCFYDAQSSK